MRLLGIYAAYMLLCAGIGIALYARRAERRVSSWIGWGALSVACAAFVLWVTDTPWFGDFESAYYPAGALISNPIDLYATDCVSGFVNIPIVALLFIPFARMEYSLAAGLFLACGLLAVGLTIALSWRLFAKTDQQKLMVALLFALAGPLLYSIREGNTSHVIFPLAIAGAILWRRGSHAVAGMSLAAASVIKPPLAIFGLYFLFRREWKVALSMFLTAAGVLAASVVLLGVESHYAWFDTCVTQPAGMPIAAFNVQSVDGFLSRLSGGGLRDWTPMAVGEGYRLTRLAMLLLLTAAVTAVLWRAGAARDWTAGLTEYSIVLVFAVVVFPVSWTHYYLWCLLPFTLIVTGQIRLSDNRLEWLALAASALLMLLPLRTPPTADQAWLHVILSVFPASHAFLGGLILLVILLRSRLAARREAAAVQ